MGRFDQPRNLQVRKCARPIRYVEGETRAVLGLHGLTGYPGELAYPAERLRKSGFDVYIPRLPGHGTAGRDFLRTRGEDLVNRVRDEWLDLRSRYERVHVLGHSMGGLLALALASTYDLSGLALLAPAVGVRLKGMRFLPLVAFFRPKIPVSWESDPAYTFFDDRDPDDEEYLGGEYWSWGFMRQLSDLAALQRKVESDLPRIHTPVLTVSARNDEVVGDKGIGLLERGVGGKFEKVILPESGHYIPYDPHPGEKEAAMDAVIDFFERIE